MQNTDKQLGDWQWIDHGIEHEQYFQGCGVSFTEFTDCYTGIGASAQEAADDAAEQAAMSGWNVDCLENDISQHNAAVYVKEDEYDLWYYVSLRVREYAK